MRLLTFVILLLTLAAPVSGQQAIIDSLEKRILELPEDTVRVNRLNDLVSRLQYTDPALAAAKATEAIRLAQKINYPLGLATAYRLRGVLYVDRMVLDSGQMFYDKAYAIVSKRNEKAFNRQAGLVTHNYGAIFHKKQEYDSAVAKYIEAIRIFNEGKNAELIFFPCTNLSSLYSYLKDYPKALSYAREARKAADLMKDPGRIISAVNTEMTLRMEIGQFDSVLAPLRANLALAREIQNYYQVGTAANHLARYYGYGKNRFDSAVYWTRQAISAMQQANNEYEGTNLIHNLGYYYEQAGLTDSALYYLNLSKEKGKELGMDYVVQYSLDNLIEIEEKKGNMAAAFKYLKEMYVLSDSIHSKTNREKVDELEAKYQSEKKDNQIHVQQMAIQRKNVFNYILIGGSALLLLMLLLIYRTYRQKQKLQQQRISELEKEKQLAATEAVLKGEEQERTRLAKDLHDGLGGMLSGIKYSLNTMKGNLIMTPENQQAFERSIDMLDSSIKEMRRVAHNMMPEALVKFGLDTAVRDFCNDISRSGALNLSYQSIGMQDAQIDQTTSITIYRIVQELVNNTMKHAAAKNAIVQLSGGEGRLTITVEDDGKGFDKTILRGTHGIGWSNIQNRVDFLKGKLDIDSQPGQGTSVHIELDLA